MESEDSITLFIRTIADILYNKPATYSTKDIFNKIDKEEYEEKIDKVTQFVLKEMFCENTGSHFLDSGGAYGRGWQRSQAVKDQEWMKAERMNVEVDKYSKGEYYINITKNTYLFLCDHITYDIEMDRIFHKFSEQEGRKRDSYYSNMNDFIEHLKEGEEFIKEFQNLGGYNTYNGESCLNKTLQWNAFNYDDEDYLILQIHNGCDVRGGYSTPHVFKTDYDYFIINQEDIWAYCPKRDEPLPDPNPDGKIQTDLDGNKVKIEQIKHIDCSSDDCGYHFYPCGSMCSSDWKYITDEEGNHKAVCPACDSEIQFYGPDGW